MAALGVLGLTALVAKPGTTPPLTDSGGQPVAGASQRFEETVELGGPRSSGSRSAVTAWRTLCCSTCTVVRFQSGLPFTRFLFADLARDFVVVDWDSRGAGKSHSTSSRGRRTRSTGSCRTRRALRLPSRALRRAEDLPRRHILGLDARRPGRAAEPELFHAFIGGSQMVSQRETDVRIYDGLVALSPHARETRRWPAGSTSSDVPYDDVFANAFVMEQYEKLEPHYTFIPAVEQIGDQHFRELGRGDLFGREYNLVEKVNVPFAA